MTPPQNVKSKMQPNLGIFACQEWYNNWSRLNLALKCMLLVYFCVPNLVNSTVFTGAPKVENFVKITGFCSFSQFIAWAIVYTSQAEIWHGWVGPTVFRGKFCQIPRRRLPNSAAHRGKFLEFLGSPWQPILEYTVPTLAQLYTYNFK